MLQMQLVLSISSCHHSVRISDLPFSGSVLLRLTNKQRWVFTWFPFSFYICWQTQMLSIRDRTPKTTLTWGSWFPEPNCHRKCFLLHPSVMYPEPHSGKLRKERTSSKTGEGKAQILPTLHSWRNYTLNKGSILTQMSICSLSSRSHKPTSVIKSGM